MDGPASYLEFGFVLISIPNLLVIVGIVAVFVIALFAPFPHAREMSEQTGQRCE